MYEEWQPWASEIQQTLHYDIRMVFKEVWGNGEGHTPHLKDMETLPRGSLLLYSHPAGRGAAIHQQAPLLMTTPMGPWVGGYKFPVTVKIISPFSPLPCKEA